MIGISCSSFVQNSFNTTFHVLWNWVPTNVPQQFKMERIRDFFRDVLPVLFIVQVIPDRQAERKVRRVHGQFCLPPGPIFFWRNRLFMKMGKECIVLVCNNRDSDNQCGLNFNRITKIEPRRSLWHRPIRRNAKKSDKEWIPGDDVAKVCSDHFV